MHSSSDLQKNYIIFTIHVSTISENAAYMCMSRTKACWLLVVGVGGGVGGGLAWGNRRT